MFFLHINNTHTKDNEMQNETGYSYDEFGRIIEKTYTQNEIFENFEIQDIRKTDKTGLDQIQDL